MPFHVTRRLRFLLVFAALLLAYAAFGFWAVPGLVRGQVEDFTSQHWQRKPALGDITFNPFTFALEVREFAFTDSGGAPLLTFDRLLVNLDIASLWRRGMSFHAIELDRPGGRAVVRADGTLNLAELSAPFARANTQQAPSDPLRLFIDRLRLADGVFEFEDHARQTPFKARLAPVNFELLDFSTTGETGNTYSLQATSAAGEKLRWNGSFGLAPLGSRGQFELADVQARTLWSYLQETLGFEVSQGIVAVTGSYEFAATEPQITLGLNLDRVAVNGLALRPRGGDADWVSLKQLTAADARVDIARRTVNIAGITLLEGDIQARRETDGSVNLLKLLEAPGAASAAARAAPAGDTGPASEQSAWTVQVPELDVAALRIDLRDEFVKPAASFVLTPVNLQLRGFSTARGQAVELDASMALETGGRLVLKGSGTPADQSFAGKVTLEQLDLAAFQPYVGTYTQMTLLAGTVGAGFDVEYRPGSYRLAGNLESSKLHTVDDALREDFVKWERLALGGIDFRSQADQPGNLRIASIHARSPYVRFIIAPDQSTNIGKVLTVPRSAPGPVQTVRGVTPPAGAQQPLAIHIGRVQVENGSANFADFWITPNYAVSLQQLGGSISGLSSRKDSRARVALTGKIDRYAPVDIAGELNLLSASLFTDLRVKFDGVELTSVTPYSGRFAGYRIEKGKLSVDVRYRVQNRELNAEQRFVIDQLALGERVDSPDAVKLPLRLAVALLKDRNGVIDLGLPVTGSLDDPKFRLGPIVWKAFVNLLAGIATSPFKLLGGMFGGGEEVNLIDFDPGSAALDAAATEKLGALTRALRERPQLSLEVPASYAADADVPALASRQLADRLAALAQARKDADLTAPAQRFELLLALFRTDRPGSPLPPAAQALQALRARDREATALEAAITEMEMALRSGRDALEAPLQALAQARARAIQDALLSSGEVDATRVFMLAADTRPAEGGKVRIALSLK
jgi:hypothetical protein